MSARRRVPGSAPGTAGSTAAATVSAPPAEVLAYARGYTCPDCFPVKELQLDVLGLWRLYVRHDDTCPNLARIEGRRP